MRKLKRTIASVSIGAMLFTTLTPPAFADTITSSNVSVRDLTSTSVTICYTLSGSGYGKVYYGPTTAYGFAYQEEAASDCGKIIRLSNLTPGTTYNYKIVSWPANGSEGSEGVSSQNYVFSTLVSDTVPPGNVADGKANLGSAATVGSTHDSVTFNWKTPGDDGWHSGPGPARYEVRYQKHGGTLFQSPSDGGYWASAAILPAAQLAFTPTLPSTMGITQSLTIAGLEANTMYRFGVLSYDAAGNASNLPGVWDIKTTAAPTDTIPPAQVTGLKIDSVANTSITFSWTAPWDPGINSNPQPAARYEIRYRLTPIETDADWQGALVASNPTPPTPVAGGTQQSYTINGLTAGKAYYIAIRAYDAGGLGSSLNATFTGSTSQPDTTPPVITNAQATSITQTSAIISFDLDEPGKAKAEYKLDGGVLLSSPEITVSSDTLKNVGIYLPNLTKATTYTYQIVATNAVGLKTTLPNLSFTTLSDTTATSTPPTTPGMPTVSNVKILEIYRDGVKIEASSDKSVTLQIEYGTSAQYGTLSSFSSPSSSQPSIEVRGLSADTIYYARAYVMSATGVKSAPSQQLQFKTLSVSTPTQPTPTTNNTFPPGNAYLIAVVKAHDGSLVQGATVGLTTPYVPSTLSAPSISQHYWASGTTNAQGEYAFPGIPAGTYELGVSPPSTRSDLGSVSRISGVVLTGGSAVHQNVTLPLQTVVTPPISQEPLTVYNVNPSGSFDDGKSIWIAWQTNKPATARVDYGVSQSFGGVAESAAGSYANNHSIQLTGLTPNTTYYFTVTSRDHEGSTATSPTYSFQTKQSSVSVPFGIKYESVYPRPGDKNVAVTHKMVGIEFNKPLDGSSILRDSITVRLIGATAPLNGTIQSYPYGLQLQLFDSLLPDTTYEVIVRGGIKSTSGETIANNYSYTFTTQTSTAAGTSVIKGVVTDHRGSPLADAMVSLSNVSNTYFTTVQTTAFGEYIFRNLQANSYTVQAHPSPKQQGMRSSESVTIGLSASETREQNFTLVASQFMIKGFVRYPDNSPVTDAIVEAWRKDGPGSVSAYVDSNGGYCMSVSPGTWMLSLESRTARNFYDVYSIAPQSPCTGAVLTSASTGTGNVPFASAPAVSSSSIGSFQPSNLRPSGSDWYWPEPPREVVVGDPLTPVKSADFTVKKMHATKVFGRIARNDGLALQAGAVSVRMSGRSDLPPFSMTVGADGRFEFPIPAGTYTMLLEILMQDSGLIPPQPRTISIVEGESKDLGTITLSEAGRMIQGTVRDEKNSPIARVKVGAWRTTSSESRFATTDQSGQYSMKVSDGEWSIGVMPSPESGYTVNEPPRIVRVFGSEPVTIDFTVLVSDSFVSGTIRTPEGSILNDFHGFISVQKKGGARLSYGAPVENGEFTLRLPAGEYVLTLETPPNSRYVSIDSLALTLAIGERKQISLTVSEKKSSITGRLVDDRGSLITDVPFKVFTAGKHGAWYSAEVDIAKGTFKISVPPGEWFVDYEINDPTGTYHKPPKMRGANVTVAPGQVSSVELKAERASSTITGRAIDTEGKPIQNVWIGISTKSFAEFTKETARQISYLNGTYSDKDGRFSFKVKPDTYYIRSFMPPTLGFTNPAEQKVTARANESKEVSLVFRPITVTVSGITTIAGSPTWAFIWAWSDKGGYTDSFAEDNGAYTLKIAPNDIWHIAAMSEKGREVYKSSELAISVGTEITLTQHIDLASLDVKLPDPVTATANTNQLAVVTNSEGVKVALPPNSAGTDGTLALSITPQVVLPSQGSSRVIGLGYDIDVRSDEGRQISSFNSDITVAIPYDQGELKRLGLAPADLSLQYWDEERYSWQQVQNAVINDADHTIMGTLAHLTKFALIASAQTKSLALPQNVSVSITTSGAVSLSWSYAKDIVNTVRYSKVYRSATKGELGKLVVNAATESRATDESALAGKTYYYTVRSVDQYDNESTNSDQVAIKTPAAMTKTTSLAKSVTFADRLKGMIVLQVEAHGEAYYVYPNDAKAYFLGRPSDAFSIMRKLGLGAKNAFITGNTVYPSNVAGKILIDVDTKGRAHYIYPKDRKGYYLGRPSDAFAIMREKGLGITNADLAKLQVVKL